MPVDNLDLKAEAILDPVIQFHNPLSKNTVNPKSILLTGATGFLGVYLLDELLKKTTADIYCLVRCRNFNEGKQRLKANLQFHALWKEAFNSRIVPIVGDLSKPHFGLSEPQFNKLASQIDVIYHSGAQVNAARPYSTLKATNVLGTQEVLRLASLIQSKPVHFMSTIAVFFSSPYFQSNCLKETDWPQCDHLKGGYRQSKWVAEQLVKKAQERGLPTGIYRVGRVLGHSKTGITGNLDNVLCHFMKGCIQLEKFPAVKTTINLMPVDYVSQAIVHLSRQEKLLGKVFHLLNPHSITWQNLLEEIRVLGYSLDEMTYHEWVSELKNRNLQKPKDKFYAILLLLLRTSAIFSNKKPQFDAHHTLEWLADSSIICPVVDTKLLSNYFSYFQKSGYIPVSQNQGF